MWRPSNLGQSPLVAVCGLVLRTINEQTKLTTSLFARTGGKKLGQSVKSQVAQRSTALNHKGISCFALGIKLILLMVRRPEAVYSSHSES